MKFLSRIFAEEFPFVLSCPALLWEIFFLYMPLCMLFIYSIVDYSPTLQAYQLTTIYYEQIFNTLYFRVIINSFVLAATTSFICFLIAYPVAYFLAMKVRKRYRPFLLFSLILPSWTSLIIQIYAWFFLLEKNGIVSQILYSLGIISKSFHLLNNYFSILIGMVSCFLPFMILPIYTVLEKMDKRYLEASADLGASRFETFKRVVFPISLPGVYTGLLLVFIPAFGEFAIPTLLGGSKNIFWGNVIVDKFLMSRDWRSGSALASFGIIFPVVVLVSIYVILRIMAYIKNPKVKARAGGTSYKDPWI